MGLFDRIKDAIFGHPAAATPLPAAPTGAASTATPAAAASAVSAGTSAPAAPKPPVNIVAVLTAMAQAQGQKLNWQSSIVDLMKLVGLDSSLDNRKQLAKELGYTGDTNDSASMNIWLHKQVMAKLVENGGQLPASFH
jgi:3-oxoacyl-ACP reductase-like protein